MRVSLNASCPFNLDATLCCGQVFRWDRHDGWWYGVAGESVLKIRQIGDVLEFYNADTDFVKSYFGLKESLPEILSQISKDEHIKNAVDAFNGLRIIHQDPWECLISYICATYKNISAIRKMLFNISVKFGEKIRYEKYDFYTFPTSERLAKANTVELEDCGLGYRAKHLLATAKMVYNSKFDFEHLKQLSYEKAKEELLNFSGVGLKVADCVLLFSLEKFEAFPVDVWVKRAILKHYSSHFTKEFTEKISGKSLTKPEYEQLSFFGRSYFGKYAGYAQEYLYHYERMNH